MRISDIPLLIVSTAAAACIVVAACIGGWEAGGLLKHLF